MEDTSRRAIGRMAFPDSPPYVVFSSLPTAGQALELPFSPMRPETVLMAVTPSAPPSLAARAIFTISVMLGVILAKNGILTAALTQRQMFRTKSGSWDRLEIESKIRRLCSTQNSPWQNAEGFHNCISDSPSRPPFVAAFPGWFLPSSTWSGNEAKGLHTCPHASPMPRSPIP